MSNFLTRYSCTCKRDSHKCNSLWSLNWLDPGCFSWCEKVLQISSIWFWNKDLESHWVWLNL